MQYEVTTIDICVQGYERLRSEDEFILVAYPSSRRDGAATLEREWIRDIDVCERGPNFHYKEARRAVRRAVKANAGAIRRQLQSCEFPKDWDGEGVMAFLYLREVQLE